MRKWGGRAKATSRLDPVHRMLVHRMLVHQLLARVTLTLVGYHSAGDTLSSSSTMDIVGQPSGYRPVAWEKEREVLQVYGNWWVKLRG